MKKIVSIVGVMCLFSALLNAQDIITKKNGEDIKARVIEVTPTEVSYKFYDEPNGVTYTVKQSDLLMIRYESGRNEVFNKSTPQQVTYMNRKPAENIVRGMKYKELKTIYNHKDYVSEAGDRYSPALSGVASFLLPGLGQMIDGEVGRGLGFFGGTVACALGGVLIVNAGTKGNKVSTAATIGSLACSLGALAIDIIAIVDGVRVAKVKNMYEQDLKNKYSFNFNIYPSFDYVQVAETCTPTAGLTLAVTF